MNLLPWLSLVLSLGALVINIVLLFKIRKQRRRK